MDYQKITTFFAASLVLLYGAGLGQAYNARASSHLPDFIMESLIVAPLQPAVGQRVTIVAQGRYHGPEPWIVEEAITSYQADFQSFSVDAYTPITLQPTPSPQTPLQSGDTFRYTFVGAFGTFGPHQLTFEIDKEDAKREVSELNNDVTAHMSVSSLVDLPDVAMNSIEFTPAEPEVDEKVTIVIHGTYNGSVNLVSLQGVGDFEHRFDDFASDDPPSIPIPEPTAILPYTNGREFAYYYVGSFSSAGTKNLTFMTDKSNELVEKNENNNTVHGTIAVKEKPAESGEETTEGEGTETGEEEEFARPETNEELDEAQKVRDRIRSLNLLLAGQERELVAYEKQLTTDVDAALTNRLLGTILLQVEERGEAWYVDAVTRERYYLRNGTSAYSALQAFGLGITSADLSRIPIGIEERAEKTDSDSDGLEDKLENAIGSDIAKIDSDGDAIDDGTEVQSGTDPLGAGRQVFDAALGGRLEGKILLQVEAAGQAWYVYKGKRYYMKDGDQAYQIMRFLSLGITNSDLRKIAVGSFEG